MAYARPLLLFILLLTAAGRLLQATTTWFHPMTWLSLGFLATLSVVISAALGWVTRRHPIDWVSYYLGIIVGRLLLAMGVLGGVVFSRPAHLPLLLANFFALYLAFAGFEIYWLLRNLRRRTPPLRNE